MGEKILTINAGSSNLKLAVFELFSSGALSRVFKGKFDPAHAPPLPEDAKREPSNSLKRTKSLKVDELDKLIKWAEAQGEEGSVVAIGHRVVHGGSAFAGPVLVSESTLTEIDRLSSLAPLHQPYNLAPIRTAMHARPDIPQVACFDTAFHRGRAKVTTRFALPFEYEQLGIERYGFHGLSYEYIASVLPEVAPELASGRVIVAHLGSGASLCALRNGRSVDTTMSFTALDGVPMATRCGAIDPGVLLYLMREKGMDAGQIEDLLYNRSGLLGVSGVSGDMRALLSSREQAAVEAIELFTFRIAREIAALAVVLGGLDGLVFTAGIGEHAPEVRRQVCAWTEWLGLSVDEAANARGDPCISAFESQVGIWVIPTDEETMIARHTLAAIKRQ